ncbi:hypothetical protein M3Y99_00422300 [Aphelenchoides fujianensis]|nr:hypothetical protein M3Y99_00422300 [Aphelenchoides fujianensis]
MAASSHEHEFLISTAAAFPPPPPPVPPVPPPAAASPHAQPRPTAIVMNRNVQRSTALSYATSQRSALPVTMKLPHLPIVPRHSPTGDRNAGASCARVREIDPKYKDKKNRPILAYRKERYTNDSRKRDYAQANRPTPSKTLPTAGGGGALLENFKPAATPLLSALPSTSAVCRPSTSKTGGDNGVRPTTASIKTIAGAGATDGNAPWFSASAHPPASSSAAGATGGGGGGGAGTGDEESVVLRVDGDVKMIVDCDRGPAAATPRPSAVPSVSALLQQPGPPKKNRPGRPRKYAEGAKAPRKPEDPDRKRRPKFQKRTDVEQMRLIAEIDLKGLDTEDIAYLRTMFGRYQLDPSEDAVVPWGQRIPWMELVIVPEPATNPQPARLVDGAPEPYFVDADLADVVPNASGCARAEPYDRWLRRRNSLLEIKEEQERAEMEEFLVKRELSPPPTKRASFSS